MGGIENEEGDEKREVRKYDRLGADEWVGVDASTTHSNHLTNYTYTYEYAGFDVIE